MFKDERDKIGGDYHGHYDWCKQKGWYVGQDELVSLLQSDEIVLVVDVRDDDHLGGNIKGSIHVPDGTFWKTIGDTATLIKQGSTVVFHCMESARRGPRCAFRLHKYLSEEQPQLNCSIRVLRGGADLWIRRFFRDPTLVENFDNDYWGWDHGDGGEEPLQGGLPSHSLYAREAGVEYPKGEE